MAATVLIVEDNALNLKYLNDLLQARGYDTVTARRGEEGLALAGRRRPDLLLLDLKLPGLSGFELAARFKADPVLAGVPIVAVTALALKEDEARARGAGCAAYLRKPVSAEGLLETVRNLIGPAGPKS